MKRGVEFLRRQHSDRRKCDREHEPHHDDAQPARRRRLPGGNGLIQDERPVCHVLGDDPKTFFERHPDRRRRVRIVLSDENALHTTKRIARIRRKIGSFVQSLQRHRP